MVDKPTYEDLQQRISLLENASKQRDRLESINNALFDISHAVNTTSSIEELFRRIHHALSPIVDTTNFYIALYDRKTDGLTFPFIVDTVDVCYPPVIGVSKTASTTALVIKKKAPVFINKAEIISQRQQSSLVIPDCTPAEVWLGVPLKAEDEIIGVMAVQNYEDPYCYDQTDMNILVAVADQVTIALQRKQAEKALQESEEKFRNIVTTVREGILSMDADWKITYANNHLAEMFGYGLDELSGQSFEVFLHPEDLTNFALRKKERHSGLSSQFERRFIKKDGSELWTIVSATPIHDEKGEFAGSFGTITDITYRKESEKMLREKMVELQQAFEQIKTLRGILPICMHCKKIRDDRGYWSQVEIYVRNNTEADFSHGICPDCVKTLYPEYEK